MATGVKVTDRNKLAKLRAEWELITVCKQLFKLNVKDVKKNGYSFAQAIDFSPAGMEGKKKCGKFFGIHLTWKQMVERRMVRNCLQGKQGLDMRATREHVGIAVQLAREGVIGLG